MAYGTASRVRRARLGTVGTLFLSLTAGCGGGDEAPSPEIPQVDATALLISGDVDAAFSAWERAFAADPQNVQAAIGSSYAAMIQGRLDEADRILASVEPVSGAEIGPIRARRALIALEAGNRDQVLEFGKSSGTAEGQILAAEAALCRSDWDDAKVLLDPIAGVGGAVGESAAVYLQRLSEEDMAWGDLAEAEACWAMGMHASAVDAAAEVLGTLPQSWERMGEEALVWANRALRERNVEAAESLLGQAGSVDALHRWRLGATKALVKCAEGKVDACVRGMDGLSPETPPRGRSDTRAMGAFLLGADHREAAIGLLGDDKTAAAAQAAYLIGDSETAARLAPDSHLKSAFGGR